jgi:uncharacterized protein (DUF1697 family)
MSTWIALLRGVGGGIRPLPMKDLTAALTKLGLADVRTYIQSGNVVFEATRTTATRLSKQIGECIVENFGFESWVMVLTAKELRLAMAANPYPKADAEPQTLHLFFMAKAPPSPDIAGMNKLKAPSESFTLKDNVLYFYAPKGFGISKLAARIDRLLGIETTARNWRTCTKVLAIAEGKTSG